MWYCTLHQNCVAVKQSNTSLFCAHYWYHRDGGHNSATAEIITGILPEISIIKAVPLISTGSSETRQNVSSIYTKKELITVLFWLKVTLDDHLPANGPYGLRRVCENTDCSEKCLCYSSELISLFLFLILWKLEWSSVKCIDHWLRDYLRVYTACFKISKTIRALYA
jgi:hypothetical protein